MRNWITLLENLTVPSFVEHVTDDLVDEMISTGKYVGHGGDLEDQWSGGIFEDGMREINPEMIDQSFEAVRHTPEFRKVLHTTLLSFAEDQYQRLINGSAYDKLPPLSPDCLIYRGITAEGGIQNNFGVYWSQLKNQSLHRFIDEKSKGWLFAAKVKDVTIDWEATIRSRLDLAHGSDEAEIQLKAGTPVNARVFRVEFTNGRAQLSDRGYSQKRA